jgi:hypothetical protein
MSKKPKTGLQEFKALLSNVKSITSWAVNGIILVPLADVVLKLGPPWPKGVPILTSLAELLVLMCIFQFCFRASRKRLSRCMLIAIFVMCLSFFGYLILVNSFTFSPPSTTARYAKGFSVRSNVKPLINDQYTENDALQDAEYDPKNVWEPWSITTVEVSLLALWLILFGSLSLFVGAFVMFQQRKTSWRK